MKKFFLSVVGVTCGLILAFALLGGGIYWWLEVRVPNPPDLSIVLDGFPDTRQGESGKKALVRIVIENNEDERISIGDAYLYLTRPSDGARANMKFEVNDISIFPHEKYVEIVPTLDVRDEIEEWIDRKGSEEFESQDDYFSHKAKWIEQLREQFNFNFTFVSDELNIRILLDAQAKIDEMEEQFEQEKLNSREGT